MADHISVLGGRPKLILIEDNDELREGYCASLQQAGFDLLPGKFASQLLDLLAKWPDVNVILSDTDTGPSYGDEEVGKLLKQGQISDSVLILGMSDDEANQDRWVDIAHHAGFFNKRRFHEDMGLQKIMPHYFNFATSQSPLWRERMQSCDED